MEQVKVTLVKSTIACLPKQKATVAALGLKKINQSKVFTDSNTLRGQLALVSHLVKVEKV
ncbi:MAG: 50S ribosomal protein L30 [Clostridia bacterium]|jgi:large subunit ribosomal protein L30|nr:50S ribosomal protein L30 [Clostridia bacterium]